MPSPHIKRLLTVGEFDHPLQRRKREEAIDDFWVIRLQIHRLRRAPCVGDANIDCRKISALVNQLIGTKCKTASSSAHGPCNFILICGVSGVVWPAGYHSIDGVIVPHQGSTCAAYVGLARKDWI